MQPLRSPVQKRAMPETTLNTWGSPVCIICSCSITLSCPTLWCHGLQHVRFSCSSPSPGVCPSSCLLCPWCNPTILSCAAPFSSCLQSFLETGSSPISWLFALVVKVLELQHQFLQWIVRVDWLVWSPCSPRESSRVFSNTTVWRCQFLSTQPSLWSNSHICTWLLENP